MNGLSRRNFLQVMGVAGGVYALRQAFAPSLAMAAPDLPGPHLMLCAYFSGGWDQLLTLDPRDNHLAKYQAPAAYGPNGTGITPAYDQVLDASTLATLAKTPNMSGIQTPGKVGFGPAMPASMLAHHADLAVVRGMLMNTLTHEVGRRYLTTGKFPRGLQASGSALTSVVAAGEGVNAILPNLAISTETYNESLPAYATGIRVNSPDDVASVLQPLGTKISPDSMAAIEAFEAASDTCEEHSLNGAALVDAYEGSRDKARGMVQSDKYTLFQYTYANQGGASQAFKDLQINNANDLKGPKGAALLASQALTTGLSQAVSVQMVGDLDDHFDWPQTHATNLWNGFDALGLLIQHLKNTAYYGDAKQSVWDHTTLLVFSEFARGPALNGRDGRDHHLASSCLLAGPGVRGDTVCGATSDQQMAVQPVNLTTGAVDPKGAIVRPADVHATLLKSMGLGYDHLLNQSPQILECLLK